MSRSARSQLLALALAVLAGCAGRDGDAQCQPALASASASAAGSAEALSSASAAPTASAAASPSAEPRARGPLPVPRGFKRVQPLSVAETAAGMVVLLADDPDPAKARLLPIFIGGTEALSIQNRLEGKRFPRPLTHDLYDRTLSALGGRVVEVRVLRLEGTTFIGAVYVEREGGELVEIDARPSDAIALAIGNDAPIHVAEKVLVAAGVTKDELDRGPVPSERGNPTLL